MVNKYIEFQKMSYKEIFGENMGYYAGLYFDATLKGKSC